MTLLSVTYGNGKFVAVGDYLEVSPDGVDWTVVDMPSGMMASSVAYGNNKFVAVGHNSINTSPDGLDMDTA